MLNRTHAEHSVIAIAIQIVVGFSSGDYWLGAAFASAIFLGREIGQAEYRYIQQYNGGKRDGIPIFAGLSPRVWTSADPFLDWLAPTLITFLLAKLL